jgi:hypothetical protein
LKAYVKAMFVLAIASSFQPTYSKEHVLVGNCTFRFVLSKSPLVK